MKQESQMKSFVEAYVNIYIEKYNKFLGFDDVLRTRTEGGVG
jgi:hypothetical protein